MTNRTFEFRSPRPRLLVEFLFGVSLGNCYSARRYRVTSTQRMARKEIEALREAGVLGHGQEFYIRSRCDGQEEPAGKDVVPCVTVVDGAVVDEPAVNPHTGDPYAPIQCGYFVYEVESRVDSSD
jgi:hypothetical protein